MTDRSPEARKLTKHEVKTLRLMAYLAIQYEESLIDANHGHNSAVMAADAELRTTVKQSRRNIAAFNRLVAKLSGVAG